MIVSASYRTDIPAFHGAWFARHYQEGAVHVANPYSGKPYRVALTGAEVDGFVFWTRNVAPFLPVLKSVVEPFIVQFTITGYPRILDERTPVSETAINQLRHMADRYGTRAVVWRYDPILISDVTPPDWHRRNFVALARQLNGAVDEVVCSFAQLYRKTERNLAKRMVSGSWHDPPPDEKRDLLFDLSAAAADYGMRLTLCAQPELAEFPAASCIDADRLSDVAAITILGRTKGNRPGCQCAESRDIGAYDTCGHGCAYCYAITDHALARRNLKSSLSAPNRMRENRRQYRS